MCRHARNISQCKGLYAAQAAPRILPSWFASRRFCAPRKHRQREHARASYQDRTLKQLAERLTKTFGAGYSAENLKKFRQFYLVYPDYLSREQIGYALRTQFEGGPAAIVSASAAGKYSDDRLPGSANLNLAWGHYRVLMRVDKPQARSFYEIEAIKNSWSTRELERQVASLLYERLAKSRDKQGVMRLATKGIVHEKPNEIFKDPTIIEFLGLPESPALTESSLESALLTNLQSFLLELGSGFAFVARQQRITLDGDHFYIDLVFYHSVLKCFVLVDLKVGKLTHSDLGQLQLYVNFYDLERRAPDDNPTLGLILCSDKNDAVVKYTLGPNQEDKIFASRYKLHLPTEADLQAQLQARRRLSTE